MFPAKVRLSGMALGTQLGFAFAGFVPTIIATWFGSGPDSWIGAAALTAALCLVNIAAVLSGRETYLVPTAELGLPRSSGEAERKPLRAAQTGTRLAS